LLQPQKSSKNTFTFFSSYVKKITPRSAKLLVAFFFPNVR
jgi:hypothetical protein